VFPDRGHPVSNRPYHPAALLLSYIIITSERTRPMPVIENLTLILSLVLGLITLITYVIRAATKNTNAIARLTLILHQLDETLRDMQAEISENRRRFEDRLDGHDSRLAALEARADRKEKQTP